VLRVSDLVSAFDSASAMPSCTKGAIYRLWGATLRAAYPTWSSMCGASCSAACLVDGNIGTAATAWATDPAVAAATYGNIADWDASAVSNMYLMFYNQPTFNADIGAWNVASVSNMQGMLKQATAFNVNVGSWNTARVTNMYNMFHSATAFNQNIASWNTASVSSMASVRPPLFSPHRLHERRVGRALMSPALVVPWRMAPRPCSHSPPLRSSASMLLRTVR
jgi:surface protein